MGEGQVRVESAGPSRDAREGRYLCLPTKHQRGKATHFTQNQYRKTLLACTTPSGPQEPASLQWDRTLKRSVPSTGQGCRS